MATLHTHLLFKGNAEEAFGFYKSVFGGEFTAVRRMKDLPAHPDHPISEAYANAILHIALPIGASGTLMGSDVGEQYSNETLVTGNRYTVTLTTTTKAEAHTLFEASSAYVIYIYIYNVYTHLHMYT